MEIQNAYVKSRTPEIDYHWTPKGSKDIGKRIDEICANVNCPELSRLFGN